jgi:peptidoglycan-associated lipoprotein
VGEVKNRFLSIIQFKMKKTNLFHTAVLSVAVLASGCKHKPVNPMDIPGMQRPPGDSSSSSQNLPPSNPFNTTPTPTPTDQPVPMAESGKWADLLNNGKQDPTKFQADTVYFEFDRATVKSSEESKLQEVAAYFKNNATDGLIVEGNCDERGTEKYNLSLGERRALAIREYLANLGMDPQRIKTVTYGASKPVDPGHDEAAYSKNRRGDLVLVTPK